MIHLLNYKGEIVDFISQKEDVVIETSMNRQTKENVEVFDFTLLSERAEGFNERNRIIVQDRNNEYREFIVTSVSESNDGTTEIESQASYIEDISKAKPFKPGKLEKMTASQALLAVLVDTGWEPSEETEWDGIRTTTWTEYKTPYDVLQQLVTTYGMVLDFKVKLGSNSIEKREVSLKKPNPLFNGKEITHGKDLDTFQRVSDYSEVNTALLAIGPEREDGSRLEIVVVDDEAQSQFGLNRRYIWGLYEPESEDQDMTEARLRTLATTELNKRKTQAVSYEVSSINLLEHFPHEIVRLGDIVRIKDRTFNPPLYAEAEVIGEEYDAISDTSVYTFGQVVEYKESSLRKYFLDRLDLFTKKANDNINGQINIITDRIDEEVEKLQQKIHRGAEPPANPQDGDFWYDTTNPKVAVLREYKDGKWQNASAHDVEQIGGLRREVIMYRQLMESTQYLSVDVSIIYERANKDLTSEYLVDLEIKNRLNDVLSTMLTKLQIVQNFMDSMTEETATIGSLMDWQSALIDLREANYNLSSVLLEAEEAMDKHFKLLQSQYSDEKFQEAMDKVANVIGGTFNPDTGELIADVPNKEMLEALEKEVKDSLDNLTQENATKLQALQDGITETNQRITNTKEELSAGITSVTKKVDGIQVGGRNLLLNSANINKAIDFTQGSYNQYFSVQITPLHDFFKLGDFITISFDVQMERGDILKIYDNNQHWDYRFGEKAFTNIGTEKQRLSATFQMTEPIKSTTTWQLAFYNNNNGDRFTIEKIKIEKGNVATAWTPAPEDAEAAIGNVKATVETQSADIKVLKDGIQLKADSTEVTKIYDNYLTPLQTQVNQQKATLDVLPSQIAAKVSQSTYDADMNNVVTRLNTADSARIQLSNEIKDRVTLNEYNNMKVGTQNLLLNSKERSDLFGSSTHRRIVYKLTEPLIVGQEYTLTYNFEVTEGDNLGRTTVYPYEPGGASANVVINNSTRNKYTFVATAPSTLILIYSATNSTPENDTTKIKITDAMLVKGNKTGDYQQAPQETAERLKTIETSISQNGTEINLKASKEEFNKTKQTLSKTLSEIIVNTTDGVTLSYDANGLVNDLNVGPSGVVIKGDYVDITANREFNLAISEKVSKDDIINRINLSSEGLDIDVNNIGIRGGDTSRYVKIKNDVLELAGDFTRTFRGDTQKDYVFTRMKDGLLRFRNNTRNRSLYYSDFGISTYIDGGDSEASGTLQFFDYTYSDARGVTLNSAGGPVALRSDFNRVILDAKTTVNIESAASSIYLRPMKDERTGTNEFRLWVKNNESGRDTDGVLTYGALTTGSTFGSGLRFDKSSTTNYVYATNNNGDIGSGDFYARRLLGDWIAKTTNLYAMTAYDGELRITDKNGAAGTNGSINYTTLRVGAINTMSGGAFANHSGGNTYFGVANQELRVTNNNFYNGGSPVYRPVTAQDFVKASSYRFKKDIKKWDYDALNVLVNELDLYSYKYKDDDRGLIQHGPVIGEDFKTPSEFVFGDGINTNEMISFSIRAIQQLHGIMKLQAKEIEKLKGKKEK